MTSPEQPLDWTPRTAPLGQPAAPVGEPAGYPPAYGLPPTRPKRRRTGLIVGLVLAVLLLAGGGTVLALALNGKSPVSLPGLPQTFTAHGVLAVGPPCDGWGYSDIRTGTEVTLTDDAGKLLSVGQLESAGTCEWNFTLKDVPPGGKFYGITISHRGTLHYTEDQLRSVVQVQLGG